MPICSPVQDAIRNRGHNKRTFLFDDDDDCFTWLLKEISCMLVSKQRTDMTALSPPRDLVMRIKALPKGTSALTNWFWTQDLPVTRPLLYHRAIAPPLAHVFVICREINRLTYLKDLMNLALDSLSICRVSSRYVLNCLREALMTSMWLSTLVFTWWDKDTKLEGQ